MHPSISRGKKKQSENPVIVATGPKFKPKISERTIQKRKEAKEKQYQPSSVATGLNFIGIFCLYFFLGLCVLIGIGGVVVCALYFNDNSNTQAWKIAGIVLGIITLIIGLLLILLTILKQVQNRPWQYKKKKILSPYDEELLSDSDDAEEVNIDNMDDDPANVGEARLSSQNSSKKGEVEEIIDGNKREMALSPIGEFSNESLQRAAFGSEMIFCPGCNRVHPSSHQCMYSTHIANGLSHSFRPTPRIAPQDSIAIQTDGEVETKKKNKGPHTVIDRSLKYAYNSETQTDVSAKPGANVTESIIVRRVPIPTAKVVVQQPTTKVMIVKVPNTAGQLVIQPKGDSSNN